VCRKIGDEAFLAGIRRKGDLVTERLGALALRNDSIAAVRGVGLIWGVEITGNSADVVAAALEAGLLLCGAGPKVVRIVPPLSIPDEELIAGLSILEGVL
jgi:acetylornithine/succinyldiaminopimelate/putrescine aminotransferase